MYKIPANTLFVGKSLVFVPECHSTNSLGAELSQKPETREGTVIVTDHQTNGRGQRGSVWSTEKNKNLTFSVIFKPSFLQVRDHFALNMAVSLAVTDYLHERGLKSAQVKWPNDVLIEDKKVCGILIENQVQGSFFTTAVVGIGLNMNQQGFHVLHAASLTSFTGMQYNLSDELGKILKSLEARYLMLRNQQMEKIESDYRQVLYGLNELRTFSSNGKRFSGSVKGVNETGQLIVATEGKTLFFNTKEIQWEY